MELKPKSALTQTLEILRHLLASGEWRHHLPGERQICERMQINRPLLRQALDHLAREGWIESPHHGCRRRILGRKFPQRQWKPTAAPVVFLTASGPKKLSSCMLLVVDYLRAHLAEVGYRLEIVTTKVFHYKNPTRSLARLIDEIEAPCWILTSCQEATQRWFSRRRIPCILCGSQFEGTGIPSCDMDFRAVARHAAGMLLARGHERIALIRAANRIQGDEETEGGFCEACVKSQVDAGGPIVLKHDYSKQRICSLLDSLDRSAAPATAYIVCESEVFLTVFSYFLQRGRKVPQQLSLISLDDSPLFDYLIPDVAHYEFDTEQFSRQVFARVMSVIRKEPIPKPFYRIVPKFIAGNTIAPAAL